MDQNLKKKIDGNSTASGVGLGEGGLKTAKNGLR